MEGGFVLQDPPLLKGEERSSGGSKQYLFVLPQLDWGYFNCFNPQLDWGWLKLLV